MVFNIAKFKGFQSPVNVSYKNFVPRKYQGAYSALNVSCIDNHVLPKTVF